MDVAKSHRFFASSKILLLTGMAFLHHCVGCRISNPCEFCEALCPEFQHFYQADPRTTYNYLEEILDPGDSLIQGGGQI